MTDNNQRVNEQAAREAFDKIAQADGLDIERGFKDGYRDADTRAAFRGFKLALQAIEQRASSATASVGKSLLRAPISAANPLPAGCYCQPGKCAAPRIMGRQTPCRDPAKRDGLPAEQAAPEAPAAASVKTWQERFDPKAFRNSDRALAALQAAREEIADLRAALALAQQSTREGR